MRRACIGSTGGGNTDTLGPNEISRELDEFFDSKQARSLVIKGPPGSGKTTLAGEVCRSLHRRAPPIVIGSRVSNPKRMEPYSSIPGVRFATEEVRTPSPGSDMVPDTPALDRLFDRMRKGDDSLVDDENPSSPARVEGGDIIVEPPEVPQIDAVKRHIAENWPVRSLVIVDSIEGLSENIGIAGSRLFRAFQDDFVEPGAANIVFVAETSESSKLDYMGDGVVRLSTELFNDRMARSLVLEKLRSVETRQPRYVFTLHGGRFRSFQTWKDGGPSPSKPWTPPPDPDGSSVSWGYPPFDRVFGGLKRGALVTVEHTPEVSSLFLHHLIMGLVGNFVSRKRGVVFIPAKRGMSTVWKGLMEPLVGHANWNHRVVTPVPDESIDGVSPHLNLRWDSLEYRLTECEKPFLSLVAFDTLESLLGENALDVMYSHIGAVNRAGHVFIALTTPLLASNQKLRSIAHIHIRFDCLNGSVIAFGEKPRTELYYADFSVESGLPEADLTPIV